MLSQMTPQYGQMDDMGASARRGMVSEWFGRRERSGRMANLGGRMMGSAVGGGEGELSVMDQDDDGGASFGSRFAGRKTTGLDDERRVRKRRGDGERHGSRIIRRILHSDGSSSEVTNDDPEGDMPSE